MPTILTDRDMPRLRYAADLLFRHFAGLEVEVTTDPGAWARSAPPRIVYASTSPAIGADGYRIEPSGLLSSEGVAHLEVPTGASHGMPVLFPSDSGDHPFDVFSAAFHLVARYEEYLPHASDAYGRFDHRQSLAHRLGFLQRPIVEEWALGLIAAVYERAGLPKPKVGLFRFSVSCDVDIAYAYRGKGFARNLGTAVRSLVSGRFDRLRQQARVLYGSDRDPYDAYDWIEARQEEFSVPMRFFFLLSEVCEGYDRNLSPASRPMRELVGRIASKHEVGLHPSWRSGGSSRTLASEKGVLESLIGRRVDVSRQHYLRFSLPDTYRVLIRHGVLSDHSMAYGGVNGYRCSASFPHPWYDLAEDRCTDLMVHPFCFMDATAFHEERLDPGQALDALRTYLNVAKSNGGTLSTVWHNGMLGTEPLYEGWRDVYSRFLSEVRDAMESGTTASDA